MKKKKIRYSELTPHEAPAMPAPAAVAPAEPPPAPVTAERPRAPLDLARALASARAAEAAAEALAASAAPVATSPDPAAGRVVSGRLTPVRGNVAIPRPTPARGSMVISRPTPVRGNITIVRDPVRPEAPAAPVVTPADTTSALRERARLRTGTADLLVFAAGGEWFGIELAAVEEAIDLPAIRHVPEMPPAMLGVITVREMLTSVYSPASALGVSLTDGSSALVFRRARGRLGIVVDDVDEVHTLDLAQLREPPAAATMDGILLGVMRYRQGLLALVDAEALIAACQTVPLMETA